MKRITSEAIAALRIDPRQCVGWVREAFLMKGRAQLPPKISLHPQGSDFINTMPCLLPAEYRRFGCKVVSRIRGQHPALKSEMMLFDSSTGEMVALVNCDWITAMRTGAVAALAIRTLRRSRASVYAFVGLGVIGRATLDCLLASCAGERMHIRLMRYKDQAERIVGEYGGAEGVSFSIADTMEELVRGADVVVSCITDADGLLVDDPALFEPGVLVVPVHTRGFQNCDPVFDKVFADDTDHVRGFRYFDRFRRFGELGDVLAGTIPGRESDQERILSYNIGIALHDVLFGAKIELEIPPPSLCRKCDGGLIIDRLPIGCRAA
ncbi:ornithine cyclodeaminase [uncultured Alistipes sp.]|uniref:ornithine cyclodeaminase n=1 Tax=uncultured Alistipes sp. TaxID=538949 RepID=UPI002620E037|nr:ornithine cyclodeaminase [uncultured Alistipes sp.]